MDDGPDPIARRDFPRSADGYDRAAVDAHLQALAAAAVGPARTEAELLAAGRLLLGQISALRMELKHVSAALREQGVAVSDALEELLAPDPAPIADPTSFPEPGLAPESVPVIEPAAPTSEPAAPFPDPAATASEPAAPAPEPAAPIPDSAAPVPGPAPVLAPAAPGPELPQSPLESPAALPDGPPPPPPQPPPAPAPALAPAPVAAEIADARLVALDMALAGSGRNEIDRELAARFELADRPGLIDDVLAALG